MFTADVSFPLLAGEQEQQIEAALSLLSACYKNGQIAVDVWPMTIREGLLRTTLLIPDETALDRRFSNRYAEEALTFLPMNGVGEPEISVYGFDPGSLPSCDCKGRTSLILFTNYLTFESPVRCGDCFNPVPLYRIPTCSSGEHLDILHWRADYKACDTLQMHCTVGERFAEQQLYRHDSSLSERGREICHELAKRTGQSTHYYLHKSRGRSTADERRRRCPNCEEDWLLAEAWHGLFEFRCDNCHLLSNIACSLHR